MRRVAAWAYKYDPKIAAGIQTHADEAAVNLNVWITPTESSLNPAGSGLTLFTVKPPKEWTYMDYNGPNSRRDKCSYPNLNALGERTAWVCDKPPDNFTCESLVEYRTDKVMIGQVFRQIGEDCECMWLFETGR